MPRLEEVDICFKEAGGQSSNARFFSVNTVGWMLRVPLEGDDSGIYVGEAMRVAGRICVQWQHECSLRLYHYCN